MTAGALAAIGGVLNLVSHATDRVDYGQFRGGADEITSLGGIVSGAMQLHTASILQLGLALLIATPVARVCYMLVGFIRERDRPYVVISAIVLLVLLYGAFLAPA
jgi:uncharacterized membrane protein